VKGDDDVYVLGVDRGSTNVQKLSLIFVAKDRGRVVGCCMEIGCVSAYSARSLLTGLGLVECVAWRWLVAWFVVWLVNWLVGHSASQSVSQSVIPSVSQLAKQSVSYPVSQPTSQSDS